MKCPFCQKEMRDGAILATGEQLCWYPRGANGEVNTDDWDVAVPLTKRPVFRFSQYLAQGWYCESCRKLILDVPEAEETRIELVRKVERFTESLGQRIEDRGAQQREKRAEKQREKRAERRRKKDPWEVD